jgi:ABC-type sugar transport system ATPase subunit
MASVTFDKATRCFAKMDHPAVCELDLEIADGEFMVLVGLSGCGKSTSLRMLAGLEDVDSGSIRIGDRDVTLPQRLKGLGDPSRPRTATSRWCSRTTRSTRT